MSARRGRVAEPALLGIRIEQVWIDDLGLAIGASVITARTAG